MGEVSLAVLVGELRAEVSALKERVAALESRKPVVDIAVPKGLPQKVADVIAGLAMGHGDLHRHLEMTARELLALDYHEADVIHTLRAGSGS